MLTEIVVAALIYSIVKTIYKRWKYDLHKIPSPASSVFSTHYCQIKKLTSELHFKKWLEGWSKSLDEAKILLVKIKGKSWLYINDPVYVKTCILSDAVSFPHTTLTKSKWIPMMTEDSKTVELIPFTKHLTPHVQILREAYSKSLNSRHLAAAIPQLNEVVFTALEKIEKYREKGPIDFQDFMARTALDVIGAVVLGVNLGGLNETKDLYSLLKKTVQYTREKSSKCFQSLKYKLFPFLQGARTQREAFRNLLTHWSALATEVLSKEEESSTEVFRRLLEELKEGDSPEEVTHGQLSGDIASCLVFGAQATGQQLSWICALLAAHPRVAEKIVEELATHGLYGAESKSAGFDDFEKLVYLTAVVKESMRFACPFMFLGPREAAEDMEIMGFRVPKGTAILVPANIGTDMEVAPQYPQEFIPERWISIEGRAIPYRSMHFSHGPRSCPAKRLALVQMKFILVQLLTHYELALCRSTVQELVEASQDGYVLEAKGGIWIRATPRVCTP